MLETTSADDEAYFELSFSPCLSLVSMVRRFVSDFYMQVLGDPDVASRIAVATHELLENSARYSVDGLTHVRIGVTKTLPERIISIDTRNRANEAHLHTLRATLDEICGAPDALAHYQVLMRRAMKRTDGSGLGLGRVRAESEMQLSYRIEGDVVMLRAQTQVTDKGTK